MIPEWAHYNRWANERLYAACRKLNPRPTRLFPILVEQLRLDRLWLGRLQGSPTLAPEILSFAALERARRGTDEAWIDWVEEVRDFEQTLTYQTVTAPVRQRTATWRQVLTHLFAMQIQMRGQALEHLPNPPPLDMIQYFK